MECSCGASRTKQSQGGQRTGSKVCNYNDLCERPNIALASQPLHSSSSKCLNNVLIPSHFKPVCLSEDICSIFGNEKEVSARFNLFLSQISPPTVLAHPKWHCLLIELHSPSQNQSTPRYAQLWQGVSMHLKSTAICI